MSATLFSFLPGRAVGKVVQNRAFPGERYRVAAVEGDVIHLVRLPGRGPETLEISPKDAPYWTEEV